MLLDLVHVGNTAMKVELLGIHRPNQLGRRKRDQPVGTTERSRPTRGDLPCLNDKNAEVFRESFGPAVLKP